MENKKFELSAFALHVIAMTCMLCDHLWATVIPGNQWLNSVGRIAYPIFAFLIVEGYFHTHDLKKYMQRLLCFAVLSEIPFNLMYDGGIIYPFHQNVLWTFLIALVCMAGIDRIKAKNKPAFTVAGFVGIAALGFAAGMLCMVDYFGAGVLTVLLFYLFRGKKWYHFVGQFVGLYWLNVELLRGIDIPINLFGNTFLLTNQGLALLALIPIWLYRGKQGKHSKKLRYAFYAFYPLHMLILSLIVKFGG